MLVYHTNADKHTYVGKAEVNGSAHVPDSLVAAANPPRPEADARDHRAVIQRLRLPRHVRYSYK